MDALSQYAQDLSYIWPEIILTVTVLLAVIADLVLGGRDVRITGTICLIGTVFATWYVANKLWALPDNVAGHPFGLMVVDQMAVFLKLITGGGLIAILLFSMFFRGFDKDGIGEYYAILVAATLGVFFLVSTSNLLLFYLAVELLSLSSYVMAGINKADRKSGEAALKYLVYGALSTGIMIYGFSLLYGMTGSLEMETIGNALKVAMNAGTAATQGVIVASIMIVAGFGYKVASFPFHFWAPDVYEGAPTPVTTFLAVTSKAGAFGVLLRFTQLTFLGGGDADPQWAGRFAGVMAVMATAGMTYGNITAMLQNNAKRMLAYSSIAHVGYVLVGFASMAALVQAGKPQAEAARAVLFYLAAYYLMNLGAFGVIIYLSERYGVETIPEYKGLGWRSPVAGATMVVFLLSLTGLPPTVGFIGKYYLFLAAIESKLTWLAVVAALNSVISLFYYFRFAKALFLRGETEQAPSAGVQGLPAFTTVAVLVVLGAATIYLGLMFGSLGEMVKAAAASVAG
jgi:NADH-quinone oxidoreductase subunit N